MTYFELFSSLRDSLITGLHMGRLRGGDRLPSVREVAQEYRVDHRVVSRAYRALAEEGLVEIRVRSGMYVAEQARWGGEVLEETARWAADVVTEGWKRRIGVRQLPARLQRCTAAVQIRCACVESVEDLMTAYCFELREDFGFDSVPVFFDPQDVERPGRALDVERDLGNLVRELRDSELVVTTQFHARPVRMAAEALGKPMIVLRQHPALVAAIERRLRDGQLTVMAADPRFGSRLAAMFPAARERMRLIPVDKAHKIQEFDPSEPVLLTRAAHERLGEVDVPLLFPHTPSISPETAHELSLLLIRLNLEAEVG